MKTGYSWEGTLEGSSEESLHFINMYKGGDTWKGCMGAHTAIQILEIAFYSVHDVHYKNDQFQHQSKVVTKW